MIMLVVAGLNHRPLGESVGNHKTSWQVREGAGLAEEGSQGWREVVGVTRNSLGSSLGEWIC